jgi:hypothetical protein
MTTAEALIAIFAVIAILISVIVGGISLYAANSAKDSAEAAKEQAASSARQANAALGQVEVAYRQLEQASAAHRESMEPYVVVNIQPSEHNHQALMLTIENIGASLARDVRIAANPPLQRSYETADGPATPIRNWHILTDGIATLPPGQRIELPFDIVRERLANDDLPDRYRLTVDAVGPFGQAPRLTYDIDLSVYKHEYMEDLTIHHVVKALREIRDTLKWFKQQRLAADAKEGHEA